MPGRPLRLGSRPHCAALALVLAVAAAWAAPALPSQRSDPTPSTPLSIAYEGSFDLTNTMVPQGVQHSYVYHVQWRYAWSGTWGDLFADGGVHSPQTGFHTTAIAGSVRVLWRDTPSGPDRRCTLKIVRDTGDSPDFRATFHPGTGQLWIGGLEAPTRRFGTYVGNPDPMCGGGPQIDIFGEPRGWKPLGDGGAMLSLSGSGVHRYDRTWRWTHSFGHGLSRSYVSAMRSSLEVDFSG